MNKLSILAAGFAALSFAACTSDEPAPIVDGEGSTMYLSVNIIDANQARSRAYDADGNTTTGAEGDYEFGSEDEHSTSTAHFLFYDKNGSFVTRATVWQPDETTSTPNVEYMGKNTLVLRNLTKTNLPVYMITLLNTKTNIAETVQNQNLTMAQTAKQLSDIKSNTSKFVMTTTSFLPGTGTDAERYDGVYNYATKLKPSDFLTEVPAGATPAVPVYVERLAAKFTIKGLDTQGVFPINVTIAGLPNATTGNVEEVPSVSEKVYVKILGYGLSCQEKSSYLLKNIEGFTAADPWSGWNHPEFYRSYWAKSLSYGQSEPDLTYCTFEQAKNSVKNPLYGYETTNTVANITASAENKTLRHSNVTSVIFAARVFSDSNCSKAIDLVLFNGIYYTYDQYKKYVLGRLLASGKLQFYKNETESTETVEGLTKKVYTYEPLTAADFTTTFAKDETEGRATGQVVLTYTLPAGTTLFKEGADYKPGDRLVEATAADVNADLASFNEQSPAVAYNGGSMFYTVPVEHLLGTSASANYSVDAEGQYGIVRNHWYQIEVGKVMHMGHGIFVTEGKDAELIIPDDPKKESYAMAAQINVLSWKIVSQKVDL